MLIYMQRNYKIIPQPNGFKEGLKLYYYQLEAVSWMAHRERNVNTSMKNIENQ